MRLSKVKWAAVLVSVLSVLSFAAKKGEQGEDFPLRVHILRVDMAQGQHGVVGSGTTDTNGNYSSHVSGGGSYLYHVYTVHIDGDQRELLMTTPAAHIKGGRGLAIATLGWSAIATARHNASLHVGDYKGRWNKDGSLEVQFVNDKGQLKHQPFYISAETPLKADQATGEKQGEAAAPEDRGTILLDSTPPNAGIYLDSDFVGNAPASLRVPAGKHVIRVVLPGYKDWTMEVTVLTDSEVKLVVPLEKQ